MINIDIFIHRKSWGPSIMYNIQRGFNTKSLRTIVYMVFRISVSLLFSQLLQLWILESACISFLLLVFLCLSYYQSLKLYNKTYLWPAPLFLSLLHAHNLRPGLLWHATAPLLTSLLVFYSCFSKPILLRSKVILSKCYSLSVKILGNFKGHNTR